MSYDIKNKAVQITSETAEEAFLQSILSDIKENERLVEFHRRKLDEAKDGLRRALKRERDMREFFETDEFAEIVDGLKRQEAK